MLKKHSNIKVVAVQPGGYTATQGLTATQNVLQAHPDLNVIVSSGDQMIAGAERAAAAAGKNGQIAMIGLGCTVEAKADILAGKESACAVYMPRTEARLAATYLIKDVRGAHIVNRTVNPLRYSPIGGLADKGNIARFTPEFHS